MDYRSHGHFWKYNSPEPSLIDSGSLFNGVCFWRICFWQMPKEKGEMMKVVIKYYFRLWCLLQKDIDNNILKILNIQLRIGQCFSKLYSWAIYALVLEMIYKECQGYRFPVYSIIK